ncbi:MAG: haloacid dehalogenase-like hydrolase [Lachnospiraceae bacterium]|nr:haloacid dehalogenase-like hydrolase [Lachnospiraceae bacterium]
MGKRLLDCMASDFRTMGKEELLAAIAGSEGRVLLCETIGAVMPLLGDVTNAELAASMGADFLLLNLFDVQNPVIYGLPKTEPDQLVQEIKRLTGRPVGINLEPAVLNEQNGETPVWALTEGRRATLENGKKACEMGVDMIVLTGNPGVGVENRAIVETLKRYKKELGDRLILAAGKMHASGVLGEGGRNILSKEDIREFVEAGADVILMPAPGSVPGLTMEDVRELVEYAHELGALTITSIGTSQEGADQETIRQMALMCKMTGTDMHHLGDSGYTGIALPENIMAYSIAVRGVRHTYRRMAASVER